MKCYISAIKAVLMENNIEICEDTFLLKSLTRACMLRNDKVRTRFPISRSMLNQLIDQVHKQFALKGQLYLSNLFKAIFASAYYGLLRIGKVASAGSHPVLAKDVQLGTNKKKIMFILRSSKTHTKNKMPQIVKIANTAKPKSPSSNARDVSSCYKKKVGNCLKHCPYRILKST